MTFMIAAYAVFWIVTFLLVFSIFNRQRNLRRDLEMVEQLVTEAQDRRQVRSDLSAKELAYHILAVYQGAVLASVAGYSKVVPILESGWAFILEGVHVPP